MAEEKCSCPPFITQPAPPGERCKASFASVDFWVFMCSSVFPVIEGTKKGRQDRESSKKGRIKVLFRGEPQKFADNLLTLSRRLSRTSSELKSALAQLTSVVPTRVFEGPRDTQNVCPVERKINVISRRASKIC